MEYPCKCAKEVSGDSATKSFPPRAPLLVGGYLTYGDGVSTGYPAVDAAAQQSYPASYPAQMDPAQTYSYHQTFQGRDSNPEVRTSVKSKDGVCERSCFPHAMLTQSPCLCSNQTAVTVEKGR
jgi:hypothetical protein